MSNWTLLGPENDQTMRYSSLFTGCSHGPHTRKPGSVTEGGSLTDYGRALPPSPPPPRFEPGQPKEIPSGRPPNRLDLRACGGNIMYIVRSYCVETTYILYEGGRQGARANGQKDSFECENPSTRTSTRTTARYSAGSSGGSSGGGSMVGAAAGLGEGPTDGETGGRGTILATGRKVIGSGGSSRAGPGRR